MGFRPANTDCAQYLCNGTPYETMLVAGSRTTFGFQSSDKLNGLPATLQVLMIIDR